MDTLLIIDQLAEHCALLQGSGKVSLCCRSCTLYSTVQGTPLLCSVWDVPHTDGVSCHATTRRVCGHQSSLGGMLPPPPHPLHTQRDPSNVLYYGSCRGYIRGRWSCSGPAARPAVTGRSSSYILWLLGRCPASGLWSPSPRGPSRSCPCM